MSPPLEPSTQRSSGTIQALFVPLPHDDGLDSSPAPMGGAALHPLQTDRKGVVPATLSLFSHNTPAERFAGRLSAHMALVIQCCFSSDASMASA